MAKQSTLDNTLKDACQITGATWAACVERSQTGWLFRGGYKLIKKRKEWLENYLIDEKVDRWRGTARSRRRPKRAL